MYLLRVTICCCLLLSATLLARADDRVQLRLDTSEAEAVLAIVSKPRVPETSITAADWQRLFASEPYIRLKKREAEMHRAFSDEDFKNFVLSPELATRAGELRRTLAAWTGADLEKSARRVLNYLPTQAKIRAKVYPVIKPRTNSFVFETETDPAIFLYLDPAVTAEQFENTVAHELHHIGFASIKPPELPVQTPPRVHDALTWMSAFGEGFAMLAAAGSPDVHPHAYSKPADRDRWDRDLANFNQDLRTVEGFLFDVVAGRFRNKEEERKKAFSFFGEQGPWYTVGYKMAVTIENSFGRAALIGAMQDPRELLALYNRAAREHNRRRESDHELALWSAELLRKIGTPQRQQ
jgi:hypothetical protein